MVKNTTYKKWLIVSVAANILLLAGLGLYIATLEFYIKPNVNYITVQRGARQYLCEDKYQEVLRDIERTNGDNTQLAEDQKNLYALTACWRNYKTGEPVDLRPLFDQIKASN